LPAGGRAFQDLSHFELRVVPSGVADIADGDEFFSLGGVGEESNTPLAAAGVGSTAPDI
jgi:hypothetical protein